MFWVGIGYFEAVGFQKRNLAHYMYGDVLVGFISLLYLDLYVLGDDALIS